MDRGTYVYCLIAGARPPGLRGLPRGLTGLGSLRLIALDDASHGLKQWLVAADAPLDRYGEKALNRGMSNIDWVSRAAIAHEAVIESFVIATTAVLPMKLFTIFASDERAIESIARRRSHIDAVLKRVAKHDEWGVRVVLDRVGATEGAVSPGRSRERISGAGYLARKKAQRDAKAELAQRARAVVGDLYDLLARQARAAKRRSAAELPVQDGPLLLDAAYLVPRTRATRFRGTVGRHARHLKPKGYLVSLSGPWPPYSFVQD